MDNVGILNHCAGLFPLTQKPLFTDRSNISDDFTSPGISLFDFVNTGGGDGDTRVSGDGSVDTLAWGSRDPRQDHFPVDNFVVELSPSPVRPSEVVTGNPVVLPISTYHSQSFGESGWRVSNFTVSTQQPGAQTLATLSRTTNTLPKHITTPTPHTVKRVESLTEPTVPNLSLDLATGPDNLHHFGPSLLWRQESIRRRILRQTSLT